MKHKYILLIIIYLFFLKVSGQKKIIDSLKTLALNEKNDSLKATLLNKIGKEYWYINTDTSALYTLEATEIAQKRNIKGIFPYCSNNLGVIDYLKGNYHKALEKYFEGLKYANANKTIKGILLNNIGMVYQELRDYHKAQEYYRKTLSLKKENFDSSRFAPTYNSIGLTYKSLHQYEIAKLYFDSAYSYGKRFDDYYTKADALGNIANYYLRNKNYFQAEKYCREGLSIKKEQEDAYGLSTSYSDLGAILLKLNKLKEAKDALLASEKLAIENNYNDLLVPVYQNMSELNQKEGDYKKALYYITKTIALKDSILSEGKIRDAAIREQSYSYGVAAVKDSLRIENEKIQTSLSHEKVVFKQRMLIYGVIIAFLFLLLIARLIFRAFKQKQEANRIIEQQKIEVEKQKELIEEHQKEILDSIQYAKRIQYTLLAHQDFVNENLPENFILFKPKDIVSGDFYWAAEHNNKFYLAVCDSTGHGVPGAFMSLLNIGFLSEAINEKNISKPNEILNYVRDKLVDSISKDGQKDGFDGILLCIDKTHNSLTYAAANNAPILISKNNIIELAKNRMPVGKGERNESFTLHHISASQGDVLYLYTDGYADQFGGPKGKKFKYKQLNDLLLEISAKSMNEQKEILTTTFSQWKGNLEQVDDVLLIGMII